MSVVFTGALFVIFVLIASPCPAADLYGRAWVDRAGDLHIETTDKREVVLKGETAQAGVDRITIAPDGRSVGWVALYAIGSTSYPVALKLLIYADGKLQAFTGNGLLIPRWIFREGGALIAFKQETVRGSHGLHYELREVATGRLVAAHKGEYDRDNRLISNRDGPDWVKELDGPN